MWHRQSDIRAASGRERCRGRGDRLLADLRGGSPKAELGSAHHNSEGDACAIRFPDARFDRAMALLVLHFVPEAEKAVSEMRRVVRPGGVVAAAVWDHLGGMSNMRMVWDTLAMQDEEARRRRGVYCSQPMMHPDEMRLSFARQGLLEVKETSLLIRMDYENFADFWDPIAAGEGTAGPIRVWAQRGTQKQSRGSCQGGLRGRSTGRPALLRGSSLGLPRHRADAVAALVGFVQVDYYAIAFISPTLTPVRPNARPAANNFRCRATRL